MEAAIKADDVLAAFTIASQLQCCFHCFSARITEVDQLVVGGFCIVDRCDLLQAFGQARFQCGTGTLRGNPEIKLRLTPEDVTALAETQAALLDNAAALVAPGGRLVYAVCALTPEEGPEQIARFLQRQPSFEPLAFTPALPHVSVVAGTFLLPVDGLDGFYLSVLTKHSQPA